MDAKLLDILACPVCKGPVDYHSEKQWFVCGADRLAFPLRDGIPVMLVDEAQSLDMDGNPVDSAVDADEKQV